MRALYCHNIDFFSLSLSLPSPLSLQPLQYARAVLNGLLTVNMTFRTTKISLQVCVQQVSVFPMAASLYYVHWYIPRYSIQLRQPPSQKHDCRPLSRYGYAHAQ